MQVTTALEERAERDSAPAVDTLVESRVPARPREEVRARIARTPEERRAALELVHESYVRAELIEPNKFSLRVTPFHLCDTTEIFIAESNGQIVSTVSLFLDGPLGIPMESMYPVEVRNMRSGGLGIAEIGCLADRRRSPVRAMENLIKLTRLAIQYSIRHGAEDLLLVSHPRHAKLYKRAMGFHSVGDIKTCPYVSNRPCEALALNMVQHVGVPEKIVQRYLGVPVPEKELRPAPIGNQEKRELAKIIQHTDPSAMDAVDKVCCDERNSTRLF